MKIYTLLSSLVGCLILSLLFLLIYGLFQQQFNTETISDTFTSSRIREVLWHSLSIAIITSIFASGIGSILANLINQSFFRSALLGLTLFQLLLSPYIFTQGWVFWFGENGYFDLKLYSDNGLIFLLTLQNIPWVILISILLTQPKHSGQSDLSKLLNWSFWKRFRLITLTRFKLSLVISFLWVFFQVFWAYDTPSMLRQNMISLELIASFGSFYDFSRALGVILATTPILLLLGILILIGVRNQKNLNFRSSTPENAHPSFTIISSGILGLLLILPLYGIMKQLPHIGEIGEIISNYQQDFWNTVIYSFAAALLSFSLSCSLPRKYILKLIIFSFLLSIFCIPSTIHGILWVSSLNKLSLPVPEKLNVVFLLTTLLLPLTCILKWGLFDTVPSNVRDLFKLSSLRSKLLTWRDIMRPKVGLTLLFLILMASREVPAILLLYPADGSTLSLTIETMLHFDQPELVSTLALMQFGFTAFVFIIIRTLFGKII